MLNGAAKLIATPDLAAAFDRAGMPYPGDPEPGRLRRFPTNGRKDDSAGWLKLFPDQDGAVFGNWRTGEVWTWQREREGAPPDAATAAAIRKRAEEERKAAEDERDECFRSAARKAADEWKTSRPVKGHAYLSAKGIGPHVARLGPSGWLTIPVYDASGEIQTLQSIGPTGEKRFLAGGRMSGGRCWLGEAGDAGTFVICEGFATGATLREATALPVCVAFNAGNLRAVALSERERHPKARIVIAGDDDRHTDGNPGRTKAKEAAKAARADVVFPRFSGPEGTDFNDLAALSGREEVARQMSAASGPPRAWEPPAIIGPDEWRTARAAPDCVVQDYLFADVGVLIAPGGTGKTTLILFEAVHIALGWALCGLEVRKPGPVLILTAEDSREMLVARLRAIAGELGLSEAEIRLVRERVRISDLAGTGFRLTKVDQDAVVPTDKIDALIEGCRVFAPVLIVIDPAVSFGVGESRVNDSEQGLIEAGRRLRRALNCCVRYVHHSGKANAREKTLDQYSGRGGSAFADGARMVAVLQGLTPAEWRDATGTDLEPGEQGLVLARPKLSYAPPAGEIYLRRAGYRFGRVLPVETSNAAATVARADVVWGLLRKELDQGRLHSKNTLETVVGVMTRAQLRAALGWLEASGRIEHRQRAGGGKGGAKTYLHPIASPDIGGEPTPKSDDCLATENSAFGSPPPIGKTRSANQYSPPCSPPSHSSPNRLGEATANPAKQTQDDDAEPPSWTGTNGWGAL